MYLSTQKRCITGLFRITRKAPCSKHLPVHVHIENSDGKATINLIPAVEVAENKNIKVGDKNKE